MSRAGESPAIELDGVSKRFRGAGRAIPVPRIVRRRSRGAYWPPKADPVDQVDVEDDLAEEEMEEDDDELGGDLDEGEEVWALRDVSLKVDPGTVLGVLGGNGSGKTTLLRVLAGMTPITEGRAILRGRVAPLMSAAPAFMQPHLTGRQNIHLLAELFAVPSAVATRQADAIAEFADVGPLLDRKVRTYSSGLYKRLGVAISLLLEPDILLADDLPSIGDAQFRDQLYKHLVTESRAGLTLVLASHRTRTLHELCTEAVLLEEGRIVDRGDVESIATAYEASRLSRRQAIPDQVSEPDRDGTSAPVASAHGMEGADAGIFSLDGEPAEAIHVDDEAIIELILKVDAPDVDLVGKLSIRDPAGRVVLRSVMREPWSLSQPGYYVLTTYLPSRLLADGRYLVTSRVTILNDGERVGTSRHQPFEFEVFGGGASHLPRDLDGPLKLPWSVFSEGGPASIAVP